ncbi:ArsR family transcriptional regulator [Ciceribacter lividus]|uniref:ArsR family transcriptional regulator n=1 Tax=Ciceribacter lividus TaxID=1197950 RepID=A0A6I7HI67_9HYPH|nr:ArsR family transcriptional regulator [Ciceribacter lividus]
MAEGPDIARIASLIGDPARSNMLLALLGGRALTATELAGVAGVTLQTASSHLAKLEDGGLLCQRKQGRHRYFALADDHVGAMIESLMGFAASRGHLRHRVGPKEPALRKARICYDHLAGDYGVRMLDSLIARGAIEASDDALRLTDKGESLLSGHGIDFAALKARRRPLCRACLDWSERRTHLAGSLGKALLTHFLDRGEARQVEGSRVVTFSPEGERRFRAMFPISEHHLAVRSLENALIEGEQSGEPRPFDFEAFKKRKRASL